MFEAKFQSFADASSSHDSATRIAALREELARQNLDGFLVPRADAHQNEYVPKSAERLAWLTGFTGSAGFAVVLAQEAAIFVDGRYVIQVRQEIDGKIITPVDISETAPSQWLAEHARESARIGYDPWVHTSGQIERFAKAVEGKKIALVPLDANPIDALWADRPSEPVGPVAIHPARCAGETAASKIKKLREALKGADAALMSDPHAICWAFNIRGADVAHTPIVLAFALLPKEGAPALYVDDAKLDAKTRAALEKFLALRAPSELISDLTEAGKCGETVMFDAATAPVKLVETLRAAGGKPRVTDDPAALPKAIKNKAELAGAREAHIRDGAALTRFLAWFAEAAPKGALTEITAAEAAETFRRESGDLRDISFPTISAFGEHAAIPHYRVTEKSNLKIGKGVYLIDSGAQYIDGTTDVTRTVVVGRASKQLKDHFTRVLKGHIAIARAVFPKGVTGAQLDAFARRYLWEAGLDFDHGVGHGVGSYLSVHEGPQRISKMGATPLQPGMILSNEPGYYRAGEYGIRLENLIIVEKREIAGAEREMYGFESITLAPFDLNCIEPKLMNVEESAWLNAYHAYVRKTLSPLLDAKTRRWLREATQAI
ncbi:aminopeptidase P family protein [Methylocystis sp. MJC1]|jgi:Xaa-Pro aminopeptidase|uniref:aminopeptidase P family protein n=1 Tax=Methylocystis sp. MJC1 TaxID=2654282 RepID=UPI0013EBA1D6|nr:aminopeptidase P family protein [Methylocystis sp. MJC1]KAF2991066.1 Aminopeptidase YpdF [Methylocystis sp. MJC1]MBU6526013.1 aminopeptidase P family protein [Methylocystis sp. MJC1]UZX12480.1 aminopeptidase P family protein [Methylocystis sp. MJC1]